MTDPSGRDVAYKQLARELRHQISLGELAPGSKLPSESELMKAHDVSRTTARQAISTLRNEGLVVTEHGRGTFVRSAQHVLRVASERYKHEQALLRAIASERGEMPHPKETPFTRELGLEWRELGVKVDFQVITAPEDVASALNLEPGTPVLCRRALLFAREEPRQMRTSYLPAHLVVDTPVADPVNQPWPGGTMAELASLGYRVTRVEEEIRARPATAGEAEKLRLLLPGTVVELRRVFWAGDAGPVEATWPIVMPADQVVLAYRIDLE